MTEAEVHAHEKSPPPARMLRPGQFSIGALLLLTLWIAVCLGLYRLSPIVGIMLGLWTVPAVIRTLIVVQFWKPLAGRLSWGEFYDVVGSSLILSAVAEVGGLMAYGLASPVALVLAQAVGCPRQAAFVAAVICGLTSAITVVAVVLWCGRPSRFDRPV